MGEEKAIEALLAQRAQTHGNFQDNAAISQALKVLFRGAPGWLSMPEVQREALDAMALKISRILSGQAGFADHWADIGGYAALAQRDCGQ